MKKFKKLVILSISSIMLMFGMTPTYAHASNLNTLGLNPDDVKVTITNDETGDVTILDSDKLVINKTMNSFTRTNSSKNVGYEVFIPIDTGISPFATSGGISNSGGVTAELYVDYDVSSNNEQVRLNEVWGSWKPSNSMYIVSNRDVLAHSGLGDGKKLQKYPSSNSFSYTTGWGYNTRIWGDASPRAMSSAKIVVSGMSGTSHTINVSFTYS